MHRRSRGCARSDAIIALVCAGVATVTAVGLGHGARSRSLNERDALLLREVHGAMLIFAREFGGTLPRPGLIDRMPTNIGGQLRDIPGRGEEDVTANTTAGLYSALITQNYITPKQVISPVERNPNVQECMAFKWDAYDPAADVYWDTGFTADLGVVSNTSYAHLVLFGARLDGAWRDKPAQRRYHLSNRGPEDGEPDTASYTCGPHGHWAGHVVANDNAVTLLTSMTPDGLRLQTEGEPKPDNLFAMESGPTGPDIVLAFTKEIGEKGPVLQYD